MTHDEDNFLGALRLVRCWDRQWIDPGQGREEEGYTLLKGGHEVVATVAFSRDEAGPDGMLALQEGWLGIVRTGKRVLMGREVHYRLECQLWIDGPWMQVVPTITVVEVEA